MRLSIVLLAGWLWAVPRVSAMLLGQLTIDGKPVLWVHDCGIDPSDEQRLGRNCKKPESEIWPGDAEAVRDAFRRRHYQEVWLASGGGSLDEGIALAKIFHEFQATVRVPEGRDCVSACTVAFMGGLFRFVDDGATYQVHAASSYLNGIPPDMAKRLHTDTEDELKRFALEEQTKARSYAEGLMFVFQQGLLRPGQEPGRARLSRWLKFEAPVNSYVTSTILTDDVLKIRAEGDAAAQQVLERIERDSMNAAIAELRAILPELGPRAEYALNMLGAMYASRIESSNTLSRETLLRMGYVTKVFETSRP